MTMMKSSLASRLSQLVLLVVVFGVFFRSSEAEAINMLRPREDSINSPDNHRRLLSSIGGGMHCGCMECDYNAWHTLAVDNDGAYTCGARIEFLVVGGMTGEEACLQVGQTEFPSECGNCSPVKCTPRPTPRCGCPGCDDIWDVLAGDYTCGARITWLQTSKLLRETLTEEQACMKVGGEEYPAACSKCDPNVCALNMTPSPTESPTPSPMESPESPGAHCGCESCNLDAWNADAGGPSCGARIEWLQAGGMGERAACEIVSHVEFRAECGACNPNECPLRTTPRCGCPECEAVLDVRADGYSCGARITWLQTSSLLEELLSEEEACLKVSVDEFPEVCGACSCSGIPSPTPAPTLGDAPNPTNDPYDFSSLIETSDGLATLLPPKHIDQSLVYARAIPTSKWWTNMIAADPFYPESGVNFPVYSHPYRLTFNYFREKDYGLHVCYSSDYRIFLDYSDNGVPRGYTHGYGSDFIFGATEFVTEPTYTVVDWDDYAFGVTVQIEEPNGDGVITTDLVTGMPFVTARYQLLTPMLTSIHRIQTINGQSVATGSAVSGERLIVTNNKGQKWAVYASQEIAFTVAATSLKATAPFDDITIRIALIPDEAADTIYDAYWKCIVTGGSLEIFNDKSYGIDWSTKGDCSGGLLHLGFPHHDDVLDKQQITEVGFSLTSATRGEMKAYTTGGASTLWTMNEVDSIPVNGFFAPRDPDQTLIDDFEVASVLEEEILDTDFVLDGGSYYFTGKKAQKYATMCLLATEPSINTDSTLAETCLGKLKDAMDTFLRNAFTYPLVYDEVYRGIVSSEGIVRNDVNAEFGNTSYNDHHFHWGYWIFTGAVLKHLDPNWDRISELNLLITSFIRDTANADIEKDPDFPLFRHFDWFSGHSSSHGLIPFFDGKDQESTSEAMNFYYSLSLWGAVSNDVDLLTLGNLMMKVAKRSVGQYLLLEDSNTVHPQIVPNKVVGLFFENKVDYTTWFGNKREYMHGIQMIPVSPINEFLRPNTFVTEEWTDVLQGLDLIANADSHRENSWQSLLFTNYAVIDKAEAMNQLTKVTLDGGLSRAWAMYFAASRP